MAGGAVLKSADGTDPRDEHGTQAPRPPRPGGGASGRTSAPTTVRPARVADLPAVARLCAAHAAFEHAGPVADDLTERLESILFSTDPRAWWLVADHGGELIGYATCSLEFSTWQGADHAHLDCLFVAEPHRGGGWGRELLDAAAGSAATQGVTQLQWQNPTWNTDAIRFYNRTGARARPKARFSLDLGPATPPSTSGHRGTSPRR